VHAGYITPKTEVLRSLGLFKFWDISDDISETVQDKDKTCPMLFIECHHYQCL